MPSQREKAVRKEKAGSPFRVLRAPSVWFRTITEEVQDPSIRLICFPAEGSSAASFAGWRDKLPPGIEVLAVELPGRGTREDETSRRELEPLLEKVAVALCHELSGPPFVFFGHRNGGFLAFALAQHLARRGLPSPASLIVSQSQAPTPRDAWDDAPTLRVPRLKPIPGFAPSSPRREEVLSTEVLEELEEVGSVPPGVLADPELSEEVLPAIEADLALRSRWIPDSLRVTCPIHLMMPEQQADREEAESLQDSWAEWTRANCDVVSVPGGARYVDTQPRLFFDTLEDLLDSRDASGVRRFPRSDL